MSERCVVCGHIPTEVCCVRCHHVHDDLNKPLIDVLQVRAAIEASGGNKSRFAKRLDVPASIVDGWLYRGWHPKGDSARAIVDMLDGGQS